MPRIKLRDTKVHYQQTGEGPDVLLVHGLSCHIAFWWFHVAAELARTHRVTAVDLRGHGFSGMTETGYRACDLAEDLVALIEHLGVEETHVVGHSFGGAVAAALTTERPDLVSELTLADAWLPSLQPVPPLPNGRDWTTTLARAHARGLQVEPQLPLVVRSLFKELLDESEFQDETAEGSPWAEQVGWEDDEDNDDAAAAQAEAEAGWRGMRFGRALWGGGRGPWTRRGGRAFGGSHPLEPAPGPAMPEPPAPRREALQGAMMMTGSPGQPSHGMRRWHELMQSTDARTEFLDPTGIEKPALRGITAPVRLVYGARSKYRPTAEALQSVIPQARLKIVPRAGHYFPLLRPQALLAALGEPVAAPAPTPRRGMLPKLRLVAARKPFPHRARKAEAPETAEEPIETPVVRPSTGASRG
ncbi:MAG: alpha/beta fold hydrolase [Paracoccaceae bacterium]